MQFVKNLQYTVKEMSETALTSSGLCGTISSIFTKAMMEICLGWSVAESWQGLQASTDNLVHSGS